MSKQEALLRQTIREMAKADASVPDSHQEQILRETVRAMLLNEIGPDVVYAKPGDIFKDVTDPFKVIGSELQQLATRLGATVNAVFTGLKNVFKGEEFFNARVDQILKKADRDIERIERDYAGAYRTVSAGLQDPLGFAFFTDPGAVITAALADAGGKGARSVWDAFSKAVNSLDDDDVLRGWAINPKGGAPGKLYRPVTIFSADANLIQKISKIAKAQGLTTATTRNKLYVSTNQSTYESLIIKLDELLKNLREAAAPSDSPLFVGNLSYFDRRGVPDISYQEDQSIRWTPRNEDIPILEKDLQKLPAELLAQALDGKKIIVFADTSNYTGFPSADAKSIVRPTTITLPDTDNEDDEKTDTKEKEQTSPATSGAKTELERISRQLGSDDEAEVAAGMQAAMDYLKNSDEVGKVLGTTKAADAVKSIILKAVNEIIADAKKAVGIKDFKAAQALVATLGPDAQPLVDLIKKSESTFKKMSADPKKRADASKAVKLFWQTWRKLVKQQYSAAINAAMQEQKIPAGSELAKIYAAAAQKIADL